MVCAGRWWSCPAIELLRTIWFTQCGFEHMNSPVNGCAESLEIAKRLGQYASFTRYFYLIGHARMMQRRPGDAFPFFERAVAAYGRDDSSSSITAQKLYNPGKCLLQLEQRKEALVTFERALSIARAQRSDVLFIADVKK